MRIGIATFARAWEIGVPGFPEPTPKLDARTFLDEAAADGLSVVQFGDNLPLGELDDLPGLARRAADLGIDVETGTRGCSVPHLRRYLEVAKTMGSPFVRVVVDLGQDEPDADEIVRRFAEVRAEYVAAGVVLAIENHDRFRVDELVAIVERCGDWVGICLDTVNSFGALEGPDVVVDALAPHTVNVHLKDFDVVRAGHNMGFAIEGRPLGEGRLDAASLLERVARRGRARTAVIELWLPFDGDIASTVATEREWAARSIRFASRLTAASAS